MVRDLVVVSRVRYRYDTGKINTVPDSVTTATATSLRSIHHRRSLQSRRSGEQRGKRNSGRSLAREKFEKKFQPRIDRRAMRTDRNGPVSVAYVFSGQYILTTTTMVCCCRGLGRLLLYGNDDTMTVTSMTRRSELEYNGLFANYILSRRLSLKSSRWRCDLKASQVTSAAISLSSSMMNRVSLLLSENIVGVDYVKQTRLGDSRWLWCPIGAKQRRHSLPTDAAECPVKRLARGRERARKPRRSFLAK